jgi:hypothetical protein
MLHPSFTKSTNKAAEVAPGAGAHYARLWCFLISERSKELSTLDDIDHPRHLQLDGEAGNTRLRGIGPGR